MLISFEGIDGCGKTTQIELLRERLNREKLPAEVLREPGGTDLSETIRGILLNPDIMMNPVTELLLFSAARSELVTQKVRPLLEQNVIVILDRFYDSTVAYQGFGRGSLPIDAINQMNHVAAHGLVPDLTFYLDIGLSEASERRKDMEEDRIERAGQSFYERVREGFNYLADNNERFVRINAAQAPEQIHEAVWRRVSALLS